SASPRPCSPDRNSSTIERLLTRRPQMRPARPRSAIQRESAMSAAPQARLPIKDQGLFKQLAFIAGRWESSADGKVKQVVNPATGEVIGTVPNMGTAETTRASEAAHAALPDWRARAAQIGRASCRASDSR